MKKVIGVRFRNAGKMYWFSPGEHELQRGEAVIVETSRGKEYGIVVEPPHEVEDDQIVQPIKEILRPASRIDTEQEISNREKERDALATCRRMIREKGLEMKLILAEYMFDNSKILFYFTADGRVDFRELVRDLAAEFKTRIELRQVGVRDETKMIGGYGICGRDLCCHAYLTDFAPVSIKMAKEQNLSLNPTKISGACGRLMCCLNNEEEVYEEINKRMPNVGDTATAPDGSSGEVISVNVLRETARIVVDVGEDREVREYPAAELEFVKSNHRRRKKPKLDLRKPDQKTAKEQAIKNAKEQAIQAAMERQQAEKEETERGAALRREAGRDNGDRPQEGNGRRRRNNNRRGRDAGQDNRQARTDRQSAGEQPRQNNQGAERQNNRNRGNRRRNNNRPRNGAGEQRPADAGKGAGTEG